MFIWRLITYYSMIILGFIVIFFDGVSRKKSKLISGNADDSLPQNKPFSISQYGFDKNSSLENGD